MAFRVVIESNGESVVEARCLSQANWGYTLEAVMNSIRNGLGMRKTEIVREPSRPRNPHFYAIFAQVHNTL